MRSGPFWVLMGFGVQVLAGVIPVRYPQYSLLSDTIFWLATVFIVGSIAWWLWFNRHALIAGVRRLTIAQWLLLSGMAGSWISASLALGAGAWIILSPSPTSSATAPIPAADDGPLRWFGNIEMYGGPLANSNIASLSFSGVNSSQREVQLKSAVLRSAIDGSEIVLKIVAQDKLVGIDEINLIPSGAPIKLTAVMPKQGGFTADEFIASWSRFNFIVTDDTREYRLPFNEATIAVFFPGRVGPRVTKKN
jgi:hypothetical protein